MATLDDFNSPESSTTLDDLQIEGPLTPVVNRPSNKNLAAYTAAMSGDPESVESTYLSANTQLDERGQSQIVDEVQNKARQYSERASMEALTKLLGDPSIDQATKDQAMMASLNSENKRYNIRDVLAAEATIAPSEPDETIEAETARVDAYAAMREVADYDNFIQGKINQQAAIGDQGVTETVADLVEMVVPFGQQKMAATIANDLRSGDKTAIVKAIGLLGSTKAEWRDSLSKVEPKDRPAVASMMLDLISKHSGVVLTDDNAFARADFMRSVAEEGYYGDGWEFVDNAISLLDLSIIGAPVARAAYSAARTARLGRSTASAAQEATEVAKAAKVGEEAGPVGTNLGTTEPRAGGPYQYGGDVTIGGGSYTHTRDIGALQNPKLRVRVPAKTDEVLEETAKKRVVESSVSPVSVSQVYRQTNPAKARAASAVSAADRTGEASYALYGTSRMEAIAYDNVGSISRTDGSVTAKVSQPDPVVVAKPVPQDASIKDFLQSNGAIYLTPTEKASVRSRVINDFANANGLVVRNEMSVPQARDIGAQLKMGVTYGARDSGWDDGVAAVEHVKRSLRHYGVQDDEIKLLVRDGGDYVPIDKASAEGVKGDYLVRVDYDYDIAATDIRQWDSLDVKRNMLDRIPHSAVAARHGSMARHALPPNAMLSNVITYGAYRGIDSAAGLEKLVVKNAESFGKKFNKLKKDEQIALDKEIRRANAEGRNASDVSLKADGFSEEAILALKDWRNAWDNIYWLENADMVKSLRNNGYGVIEDVDTGTRLFAKERSAKSVANGTRALDITTGEVRTLTRTEIDEMYEAGHSVAALRSSYVKDGEAVQFVISNNNAGNSYLRRLRDQDQVLTYREGYYTVFYDTPKFVVRREMASDGKTVLKESTVKAAGDIQSAHRTADRLTAEAAEENIVYAVKDNRDRFRTDSAENWGIQEASGRIAQRVRGERLADATMDATEDSAHILGPVDSLVRSARSVSTRVPMRDYLEVTKQRAVDQYGHMFPKDEYGRVRFPADSSDIKASEAFSKEAADARTTVEYIHSLEHGYINGIDEGIRYALSGIADDLGLKGMARTEKALNAASTMGPTRFGRSIAFTLYLALNPLRQIIVQAHQAVQLFAINPAYAGSRMAADSAAIMSMRAAGHVAEKFGAGEKMWGWAAGMTGRSESEVKAMVQAYERSGLSAAIDKQNLVRDSLTTIADDFAAGAARSSRTKKVLGVASKGVSASRKAGFDMGEEANMLTSWLAHYDMAVKQKGTTNLSKADLDLVAARARNFTYGMNRAGDMPYNENSLGLLFQFMQVPHKAAVQMAFDRGLTRGQRARLAAFNTIMYGAPAGSMLYAMFGDVFPEGGEERELILQGLEGAALNKMIRLYTGDETNIDFTGLAANNMDGIHDLAVTLMTEGPGAMLAESPAGSMFFGNNPRITNAARTLAETFHFVEPADGTAPEWREALREVLKLSSGVSNFYKAALAHEELKSFSSSGKVSDGNMTPAEATARAYGFSSVAEQRKWAITGELYEKRKEFDDDVKAVYKNIKQALAREGVYATSPEFQSRVINAMNAPFKDSPKARQIIQQQLKYDVEVEGDVRIFKQFTDSIGFMERDEYMNVVNSSDLDDSRKEQLRNMYDNVNDYTEE